MIYDLDINLYQQNGETDGLNTCTTLHHGQMEKGRRPGKSKNLRDVPEWGRNPHDADDGIIHDRPTVTGGSTEL